MASNWKGVERIMNDTSNTMNVTIQVLGHLTFDHLVSLELSGDYERRPEAGRPLRHERTRALVQFIHNAPALERLIIRYSAVRI